MSLNPGVIQAKTSFCDVLAAMFLYVAATVWMISEIYQVEELCAGKVH